jgi:hypothetical protein
MLAALRYLRSAAHNPPVGVLDWLTRPQQVALSASMPVQLALESPNQSSSLAKVVYAEYFTGEVGEVTRESALQIPAIKKARDILVGAIAGAALKELADGVEVDTYWLRNSRSGISPWHRMAYVVDDLLFYDWSLLAVERDGDRITDAVRVPWDRWHADEYTGEIRVDDRVRSADEVVLIPGSGSGGLLTAGAPTIRGYRALERAWIGRAQNPIPLVELHQITDDQLDDDEIDTLVSDWSAARTSPTGSVGFTDNRVEVRVHGTVSADLFEQGRNAAVLDIARLTGVPASLLDGAQTNASLTYVTSEGKRSEFDALSLPQWTDPIEARLSLDDVSPEGHVIRFDKAARAAAQAEPVRSPASD